MSADELRSERLDRRQRKSRAALRQALLRIIAVKPFDAVTVDEIADSADVTRATFYAHYRDKAALLSEAYEQLVDELAERVQPLLSTEGPFYSQAAVSEAFRHAEEHADLYRAALSGAAGSSARTAFTTAFQEVVTESLAKSNERFDSTPRIPPDVVSTTFAGALSSTIEAWLNGRLGGSPTEIAEMFVRIQFEGVGWALGLSARQLRYKRLPA